VIRKITFFVLTSSTLIFQAASAAEEQIDCSVGEYNGTVFTEIHEAGRATGSQLCKSLLLDKTFDRTTDENALANSLATYAHKTKDILINDLNLNLIVDITGQVDSMVSTFENFPNNQSFLKFRTKRKGTSSHVGFFGNGDRFVIPETNLHCDSLLPGKNCLAVFEELESAFNAYRKPYETFVTNTNTRLIDNLSKDWDRFLEVSKSQTALEVFLTTTFQRSHFQKDYLVGPPSYQIIALHPQLIYESLGDAPDGERLETWIALEWFGINWWDTKVPFGFSFTRVYVDRPSGTPYGNGLMLHFNNQYSIGFADHDGDESVFVTFDLLKLLEDKKANLEQYLDYRN